MFEMPFQGQNNHSIRVITQELNYLTWTEAFTCLSDDRLPDQLRAMYCDLIISKYTVKVIKFWTQNNVAITLNIELIGLTVEKFHKKMQIITKTSLCNEHPLTPHFYIVKVGFTGVFIFSYFCSKT